MSKALNIYSIFFLIKSVVAQNIEINNADLQSIVDITCDMIFRSSTPNIAISDQQNLAISKHNYNIRKINPTITTCSICTDLEGVDDGSIVTFTYNCAAWSVQFLIKNNQI